MICLFPILLGYLHQLLILAFGAFDLGLVEVDFLLLLHKAGFEHGQLLLIPVLYPALCHQLQVVGSLIQDISLFIFHRHKHTLVEADNLIQCFLVS